MTVFKLKRVLCVGAIACGALACESTATAPVSTPSSAAPAAVDTPTSPPAEAPAEAASAAPAPAGGTLGEILEGAESVALFRVDVSKRERAEKAELKGKDALAPFLAALGRNQKANGPLVRCPSDAELVFRDGAGKELGKVGVCTSGSKPAARLDTPDGSFGGLAVADPDAFVKLLERHGLAARRP